MQIANAKENHLTHHGSFGERLHAKSPAVKLSAKVNALNLEVRMSPSTKTLNKRVSNIGSELVRDSRQSPQCAAAQLESRFLFPDSPPSPDGRTKPAEKSVLLTLTSPGRPGDAVFGRASSLNMLSAEGVQESVQADVIYGQEAAEDALQGTPIRIVEDVASRRVGDDNVNKAEPIVHADMTGIKPATVGSGTTKAHPVALEARMMRFDRVGQSLGQSEAKIDSRTVAVEVGHFRSGISASDNTPAPVPVSEARMMRFDRVGQSLGQSEAKIDSRMVAVDVGHVGSDISAPDPMPVHEAPGHEVPKANDAESCLLDASKQAGAEETTANVSQCAPSPPSPHVAIVSQSVLSPTEDQPQWVSPAPHNHDEEDHPQWVSPAPENNDAEERPALDPDPAERLTSEEVKGAQEEDACETPETELASRGEDELASADSTASPAAIFLDKADGEQEKGKELAVDVQERGLPGELIAASNNTIRCPTPEIDEEEERQRLLEQLAMKDEMNRYREQQVEVKRRKCEKQDGDGSNRRMLPKNDLESRLFGPTSSSDSEGHGGLTQEEEGKRGPHAPGSFKERVRSINLAIKWKSSKF